MSNVYFAKGETSYINQIPIIDGQILFDTTAHVIYVDHNSTREPYAGSEDSTAQAIFFDNTDTDFVSQNVQNVIEEIESKFNAKFQTVDTKFQNVDTRIGGLSSDVSTNLQNMANTITNNAKKSEIFSVSNQTTYSLSNPEGCNLNNSTIYPRHAGLYKCTGSLPIGFPTGASTYGSLLITYENDYCIHLYIDGVYDIYMSSSSGITSPPKTWRKLTTTTVAPTT